MDLEHCQTNIKTESQTKEENSILYLKCPSMNFAKHVLINVYFYTKKYLKNMEFLDHQVQSKISII